MCDDCVCEMVVCEIESTFIAKIFQNFVDILTQQSAHILSQFVSCISLSVVIINIDSVHMYSNIVTVYINCIYFPTLFFS